jgi:hypothetical protein
MSVRLSAGAEAAAAEQFAVHGDERTAAVGVEAAAAEQDVVHGSERAASVGAVPSVRPTELRASWTTSVTSSDTAVGHPPQRQGHAGDGRNRLRSRTRQCCLLDKYPCQLVFYFIT